jgi:hypothetical protein
VLPDETRQALIRQAIARTEEYNANRIVWPNPEDVKSYVANTPAAKQLPDWRLVERALIDIMLGYRLAAEDEGNLIFGEFNLQFGDDRKARWFLGAYKQIFWRHHVLALEEVQPQAIDTICKATGYAGFCTKPNSRGQAVAVIFNDDRLELLGEPLEVTEITGVQGIPELRPAMVLQLRDKVTGKEFGFGAVHLKSMLGGEDETAPVRAEQIEKLLAKLGPDWNGVLAGDWNFHMDRAKLEMAALEKGGFKRVGNAVESTQQHGGCIDGFYTRGMGSLTSYATKPMWKGMPKVKRSGFSDHGLTRCQQVVRKK